MRMGSLALLVLIAFLPQHRVAPDRYHLLMGSGNIGSAFLITYQNKLWAVMSVHQFEGRTPTHVLERPPDTGRLVLDGRSRMLQKDIQAMPILDQAVDVRFLDYDRAFVLHQGEAMSVVTPEDGVVPGTLADPLREPYSCQDSGVRQFHLRSSKPFDARRAAGAPVVSNSSGAVVGVVVTADQALGARVVGFETLCFRAWEIRN